MVYTCTCQKYQYGTMMQPQKELRHRVPRPRGVQEIVEAHFERTDPSSKNAINSLVADIHDKQEMILRFLISLFAVGKDGWETNWRTGYLCALSQQHAMASAWKAYHRKGVVKERLNETFATHFGTEFIRHFDNLSLSMRSQEPDAAAGEQEYNNRCLIRKAIQTGINSLEFAANIIGPVAQALGTAIDLDGALVCEPCPVTVCGVPGEPGVGLYQFQHNDPDKVQPKSDAEGLLHGEDVYSFVATLWPPSFQNVTLQRLTEWVEQYISDDVRLRLLTEATSAWQQTVYRESMFQTMPASEADRFTWAIENGVDVNTFKVCVLSDERTPARNLKLVSQVFGPKADVVPLSLLPTTQEDGVDERLSVFVRVQCVDGERLKDEAKLTLRREVVSLLRDWSRTGSKCVGVFLCNNDKDLDTFNTSDAADDGYMTVALLLKDDLTDARRRVHTFLMGQEPYEDADV